MLHRTLEQHLLLNGLLVLLKPNQLRVPWCRLDISWKLIPTHVLMITVNLEENQNSAMGYVTVIAAFVVLAAFCVQAEDHSVGNFLPRGRNYLCTPVSSLQRDRLQKLFMRSTAQNWNYLKKHLKNVPIIFFLTECAPHAFRLKKCNGGHGSQFYKLNGGGKQMCVLVSNRTMNFEAAVVSLGTQRWPTPALITNWEDPIHWPRPEKFHFTLNFRSSVQHGRVN